MTRDRILAAARVAILAGIYVLALLVLRGIVSAQDRVDSALALAVAKVAVNEASLAHVRPAEVALIWQVTEARASTSAARLAWLRAHSPCVLGDRDVRPGNCRWTRHLRDDDTQPEGWPEHLAWSRYAPRWRQVRALARRLVSGRVVMRPCPRAPWTWGGREIDMARALERGLVPLGCRSPITGEPTLNEGFALARGGAS